MALISGGDREDASRDALERAHEAESENNEQLDREASAQRRELEERRPPEIDVSSAHQRAVRSLLRSAVAKFVHSPSASPADAADTNEDGRLAEATRNLSDL